FLGHLLDRFDLEFFRVTLTTHGTSYLGLIMRLGGVYETRGDSISYRRRPGLDSLTRIYKQDVGAIAFAVLERVLPNASVPRTDSSYIPVRQQLRPHVNYHVLKRLVDDQAVPAELRDTLFSIDLGL
ncbi:hypothetical protein, partial [Pseudomonas mosselii]|uniref:hypothetical protein n=1 Tax=Pseudomonas mosselii TaxID=78327 RepID=UPI001C711D5C